MPHQASTTSTAPPAMERAASSAQRRVTLAEHRGRGFLNLLSRDVTQMLCEGPAVAERVGDLAVALAPKSVLERLPDLCAGIDRAFPQRIDVIRVQVQDSGGAPDAERRQHAELGELVCQHHRGVPEPQLD